MNKPIFTISLNIYENTLNRYEVKRLLQHIDTFKVGNGIHTAIEGFSSFNDGKGNLFKDLLKEDKDFFEDIIFRMESYVADACLKYGYQPLEITNSWFNIQTKNTTLKRHTHANSVLSAALYLQVNEKTGPIVFHNVNPYLDFTKHAPIGNTNSYKAWAEKPEVGKLIIFPSWLSHETVLKEKETKDRIVISFNIGGI